MSISRSRRTSNREKGKLKLSLRIERTSSRIGTITIDLRETLRGILGLLLLR